MSDLTTRSLGQLALGQRLQPLFIFGYIVAGIRLGLDATAPDFFLTMYFGLFYLMPVAFLVVGLRRAWGPVRWTTMASTMVILAILVWGVWNTIAYTTGQFMEWTHGRFDPGTLVDGTKYEYVGGRAAPPAATALGKVGWGVAHGLLSSLASSVWCILFGTLFIWLPARLGGRRAATAA